jgi:hypothetical protein
MSALIRPADKGHECALPWRTTGYGSTGEPEGTLVRCDDCGQWWFCAPCYESLGPTEIWRKVRWFHWRLRRHVDEQTREARS